MDGLRRVLHVGPIESRGGMQATIQHHLASPPPGWKTEGVNTHVDGSVWAKLASWRSARRELKHILATSPPDLVHIHTATRYSWWRKSRAVRMAIKAKVPVVLQVHAGNFHHFLRNKSAAAREFQLLVRHELVSLVVLTPRHKREIGISDAAVIGSPAPSPTTVDVDSRTPGRLVLLARPSVIKGHRIAIEAVSRLNSERDLNLELHLSGVTPDHKWMREVSESDGVHARGWLSGEEKEELLNNSGFLLVPSNYEGMPVAVMEALSCGLPVLASASCDGILGDAGIIVDDLQVQTWMDAIEAAVTDEVGWRHMSSQCHEAIKEQTPEELGRKWASLYDGILEGT